MQVMVQIPGFSSPARRNTYSAKSAGRAFSGALIAQPCPRVCTFHGACHSSIGNLHSVASWIKSSIIDSRDDVVMLTGHGFCIW